jgi:hypothetical protein
MLRTTLGTILFAVILATVGSRVAGAQTVGGSGNDFIPAFTSDVGFINHGNSAAYNADSSFSRNVTTGLNSPAHLNAPVTLVYRVYGKAFGQTISCSVAAQSYTSGSLFTGSASVTPSGFFNLAIPITVSTSGLYSMSVFCQLPPFIGSGSTAFLYGWTN